MLRKLVKSSLNYITSNNYLTLNYIELHSSKVLENVDYIKSINPGFSIMTVLKANAYGHGLLEVAKILNKSDVSFIAVDGYFEAAKVRDISNHKILVMGYVKPENVKLIDIKKCSFVIQDIDGLKAISKINKKVSIHIELNTGMNRLGLNRDELEEYLDYLDNNPKIELGGIMSHLADADNGNSDLFTQNQVELFDSLVEKIMKRGFKPKYIHLAQTAGSTKVKSRYANTIRLGIGLYGINPLSYKDPSYKKLNKLQPILDFKSTIIKSVNLNKGDKVSYNGIFTANKSMRIGILPVGYYEGIPRELSDKGYITVGNKPYKIVGRVCMNHTMIDITDSELDVNSIVTIFSSNPELPNSINKISSNFNLFSYTLVTGISSSVKRVTID